MGNFSETHDASECAGVSTPCAQVWGLGLAFLVVQQACIASLMKKAKARGSKGRVEVVFWVTETETLNPIIRLP